MRKPRKTGLRAHLGKRRRRANSYHRFTMVVVDIFGWRNRVVGLESQFRRSVLERPGSATNSKESPLEFLMALAGFLHLLLKSRLVTDIVEERIA